jgi:ubiquinone/menaquinone biosynthesis C-methylase UbiE
MPVSVAGWIFAAVYDRFTAGAEAAGLSKRREQLLAGAAGRVLEIGAGTGANLAFYPGNVQRLTLAEPERPMARRLARRVASHRRDAEIVEAPAERLPFPDGSFDTVVSTLVLCTVADPPRALSEIRRVLAPGGRLLFIEHVRSDDPRLARWQDRLNGLNQVIAHGCNCNRATLDAIRAAGFTIADVSHENFPKAPPLVRPLIVGVAGTAPIGATSR